jgi:long-chain acyl-CoA synthetase
MPNETLIALFERSVSAHSSNMLLWEKRGDVYRGITYRRVHQAVERSATGLLDLGVRPGERIALIAEGKDVVNPANEAIIGRFA